MEITNLTLAYQILEIEGIIEGAFVKNVQEVGEGIFKFRLNTRQGMKNLIVNPSVLYLTEYKIQAKQDCHGFSAFLKKYLKNKKILSIKQHGFDRIAVLEFEEFFLILEFFHESNIILADRDYRILNSLKWRQWKDRTVRRGELYKFPPSRGKNPEKITFSEFKEFFNLSSDDCIRTLIKAVNIAPVFAEEILFELGIEKTKPAKGLGEKHLRNIYSAMKEYYSNISKQNLQPVLTKSHLLPFKLQSIKVSQAAVASLNEATDDFYSKEFLQKGEMATLEEKEKEISKLQFNLEQLNEAKKRFEKQVRGNKRKAELIYSHFDELQELINSLKQAEAKGAGKKDVMYKLKTAAEKGNKAAKLFSDLDLKRKELTVELK